jgi:hypothetical protein
LLETDHELHGFQMKVVLFTDYINEYYIHPADIESVRSNAEAVIDIPDTLYQKWLDTRQAWRDVAHEIEAAMHQAVYDEER